MRTAQDAMIVVEGTHDVPAAARGGVYAIGNFDGVHRGHQVLLSEAVKEAKVQDAPAGAMIFEPHPIAFFTPDVPHFRLTPLAAKLELLEQSGLDVTVVMPFDAELANLSAQDFIQKILVEGLGAKHVVIGYDFHFGKKRSGSPEILVEAGQRLGFGVSVISPQSNGDMVFSSSQIRKNLAAGHVAAAANLLGHWWSMSGPVVGGAKRGSGLGFPTANIELAPGVELLHGIYAVRVRVDDQQFDAAAYLGTRPTFDDGAPVLEVFLFDFDGDLYGRTITVQFIDFIRGDQAFADGAQLVAQMTKDCEAAKSILAKAGQAPLI